ncbi:hypothetical protein [Sulfurimonas sp.]|uniref:hypothetical protein n=1 Tax=Sulfurimonas sp. TaxID=2022749 RepID=UPI002AB21AA1|nr:hypothetical protein [Sulfurimonas sp.]
MKRAMSDFPGGVGYGAIVILIEHLKSEPNYEYPLNDLDLLAIEFNISLPILSTIIKNYDYFDIKEDENGTQFFSPMLINLMIPYDEKVEKNRIAGKISAKKKKEKQEQQLKQLESFSKKNENFIINDEIPNVTF